MIGVVSCVINHVNIIAITKNQHSFFCSITKYIIQVVLINYSFIHSFILILVIKQYQDKPILQK